MKKQRIDKGSCLNRNKRQAKDEYTRPALLLWCLSSSIACELVNKPIFEEQIG